MTDPHHAAHEHHGPTFRAYMIIALILAICTSLSFLFNQTVPWKFVAFVLILGVAITKATLVGMYFMHLKWDWKLLYFLIIPAFILGTMMMVVLMPDILLGAGRDMNDLFENAQEMTRK
jgi:cytochrome c oxidase subunit 4